MDETINVQSTIRAPMERVWNAWSNPDDILKWNAANADWHTTAAEVDLREGGRIRSRMEARDGSFGFDFCGTYAAIEPMRRLVYRLDDERTVNIDFTDNGDGTVTVSETFDAESMHSVSQQREGWQAILDSFKRHVENHPTAEAHA